MENFLFEIQGKTCKRFSRINSILSSNNFNAHYTLKIKIPYSEFDMCYDVYSQNPVEVRNILSYGVMARIIEFNEKIDKIRVGGRGTYYCDGCQKFGHQSHVSAQELRMIPITRQS